MASKNTIGGSLIKLDINQLYNEHCYKWSIQQLQQFEKTLLSPQGLTRKYTHAQETKHKENAENGKFLCKATLVIEYKTDGEAMKIARALKKLAETASVKLNVTFKKI